MQNESARPIRNRQPAEPHRTTRMPEALTALACVLASGIGFYFSLFMGAVWPLAWVAAAPVLWFAFRDDHGPRRGRTMLAGLVAWASYALGGLNLVRVYFKAMPTGVLIASLCEIAFIFALCVLGARFVARHVSGMAGVVAFASLWTAADFLLSFGPNGTASSPAYSQVGAPVLIQSASLFGLWAVTFALGFVSAGLAMALARRRWLPAVLALALFAANAGFGSLRMAAAKPSSTVRVGLAGDDALVQAGLRSDAASAQQVAAMYALAARSLAAQGARLIVFPERAATLQPAWRSEIVHMLSGAAQQAQATIVIGFADPSAAGPRNDAYVFSSNEPAPLIYNKRHLVPGLEARFVPGHRALTIPGRTGIAICKDLDFPKTVRAAASAPVPSVNLMAVPAWDFSKDAWWHARLAILRGVENGFAVARSANDGLLTLSDAYGRVLQRRATAAGGLVTVIGDLPRGPGRTLYRRIGDAFAWAAVLVVIALLAGAISPRLR